jgi:hypothetical protein
VARLQREPAAGLDRFHRQLRDRACDAGEADELAHVEVLVGGEVGGHNPEQVVGITEHPPALDHLVDFGHSRLERFHRRQPVLHLHGDVDEHLEAAVNGGGIDDGLVAGDDPRCFEPSNAAQAGGGTQPDAFGELDVRETPVRLEMPQNCSIYAIYGTKLYLFAEEHSKFAIECGACRASVPRDRGHQPEGGR